MGDGEPTTRPESAVQRAFGEAMKACEQLSDEIRMMRLDAIGRFLARYAGILWWLHVAEALSSPYLRED